MRAAFTAIACLVVAVPLSAQGPARLGLSTPTVRASTTPRPPSPRDIQPTEWKKGMIIGGIVGLALGALGVAANHQLCESSNCPSDIVVLIAPVPIFALIGSLIGSGVHKKE